MPDMHSREQLIDLMLEAADNLRSATKARNVKTGEQAFPSQIAYWLAQMDEYRAMIAIADNHGGTFCGAVWNNAGSAINADLIREPE